MYYKQIRVSNGIFRGYAIGVVALQGELPREKRDGDIKMFQNENK